MTVKLLVLICICLVLSACTPGTGRMGRWLGMAPGNATAYPDSEIKLFKPCTLEMADKWSAHGDTDKVDRLRAASCYVTLVEKDQGDNGSRLSLARKGREQAKLACAEFPESAMAHYLNAYLTGLVAENDPLQGLQLVHDIEREALLAAKYDPGLNHGGPDRMLGELYTKAPGYPVSIGDSELGVEHFRLAVRHAPDFTPNRLGLVDALMAEDENEEACHELHALIAILSGSHPNREDWDNTLEMMKKFCYQY